MKGRKLVLSVIGAVIITSILTFTTLSLVAKPVDVKTQLNTMSKQYNFKVVSEVPKDRQAIQYDNIAEFEKDQKILKQDHTKVFNLTDNMKGKKVYTPKGLVKPAAIPLMMQKLSTWQRVEAADRSLSLIPGLVTITTCLTSTVTDDSGATKYAGVVKVDSWIKGLTTLYHWTHKTESWFIGSNGYMMFVNVYGVADVFYLVGGTPLSQTWNIAFPMQFWTYWMHHTTPTHLAGAATIY